MTLTLHRGESAAEDAPLPGMIGEHPLMKEVYRLVRRVAPTDLPLLIVGETGTGKELVARAIHELSPRRRGPFVAVNAAAIPESLFESELFGHQRGAFSDARAEKPGLLEIADRGTFFCDEIIALPSGCQAKLLRVIEEGCARRVGGVRARPAAPRWLAACQRTDGLREDLRHRLASVPVHLPLLHERATDIPLLLRFFLAELDHGRLQCSSQALDRLTAAPWPGNVRELRRLVERCALIADGPVLDAAMVERELTGSGRTDRLGLAPDVEAALAMENWNVTGAAHRLGVHRSTLHRWITAAGARRPRRPSQLSPRQSRDTCDTPLSTDSLTP